MILSDLKCYQPKIFHGCIIPCGKCYACKLKIANDWSIRLHQEALHWNGKALFVTLTYDDAFLNLYNGIPVLSRKDIQDYHKRLRHKLDTKLTYFLAAEYGPTTLRPHYHAIYFGLDYSNHDDILSSWKKGYITCSLVSDGRIAYVSRYSLLPQNLPEFYTTKERKPFMLCSKGLGISYLENPQTIKMHNSNNQLFFNDNGYKKSLPRYYKNKIFSEDKRKQFADEYYAESKQKFQDALDLHKDNPKEFERRLKLKKDWIYDHSFMVENKMLKKPKI